MTAPTLDTSLPAIQWNRLPISPAARSAVDRLTADMVAAMRRERALRQSDHERLAATLGAFVSELYSRLRSEENPALRMSRRKANYSASRRNRYNASPVTHTNACRVADWLVAEGFAGTRKGYYQRYPGFGPDAGAGQQSRIWATERLASFLEKEHGLTPHHFGFAPWVETVVLRDVEEKGVKRDIDYADTPETERMRANLRTINAQLSGYRLSVVIEKGRVEELPPFRLTRIFSRGSFELGGRFYRAPWIVMEQEMRARLLIDGEETVELDYPALHPRLIYARENEKLEGDPYAVRGWEGPELRGYVKRAFQQLLNADPTAQLRKPRDIPSNELPKGGWQRLLKDLAKRHKSIAHWFRSGRGLELQRLDSDMAEQVVLDMLGYDVCCLPVHDSFIVPKTAKDELADAMKRAYEANQG